MSLIEKIDLRFTIGNSVPVERAHITAVEWKMLRDRLFTFERERIAMLRALHEECGSISMETAIGKINLESRILIRAGSLAANAQGEPQP